MCTLGLMILPFAFLHGTVEVRPSVSESICFGQFDSHTCYYTKVQLRLMNVLETKMKN